MKLFDKTALDDTGPRLKHLTDVLVRWNNGLKSATNSYKAHPTSDDRITIKKYTGAIELLNGYMDSLEGKMKRETGSTLAVDETEKIKGPEPPLIVRATLDDVGTRYAHLQELLESWQVVFEVIHERYERTQMTGDGKRVYQYGAAIDFLRDQLYSYGRMSELKWPMQVIFDDVDKGMGRILTGGLFNYSKPKPPNPVAIREAGMVPYEQTSGETKALEETTGSNSGEENHWYGNEVKGSNPADDPDDEPGFASPSYDDT
jgi:hypothetical protein